jgi:hypothetical protein
LICIQIDLGIQNFKFGGFSNGKSVFKVNRWFEITIVVSKAAVVAVALNRNRQHSHH